MKIMMKNNPLFCGILFILFLFIVGVSSCQHNPKELYPGQQAYLIGDSAHRYVRENIVNKSSFSVESRYFADIKLFDTPEKIGKPITRVRKFISGSNGVATVIPQKKGYLITAGHVVNTAEVTAELSIMTQALEKANPGMYLDAKLVAEYHLVNVDGKSFLACIVAVGEDDLGLMQVKNLKNFTAKGVPLSKETDLADKSVFIIGDPLGIHDVILDGRIANGKLEKTDDLGKSMYVVAPIVPGNSGGAVILTSDLKMVGVVSAISISGNSLTSYAFFVPNTVIEKFLKKSLPK